MWNGINGSLTRRSLTRKPTSRATATNSGTIVRAVPQPTVGALEIAYTSNASPALTSTAPSAS